MSIHSLKFYSVFIFYMNQIGASLIPRKCNMEAWIFKKKCIVDHIIKIENWVYLMKIKIFLHIFVVTFFSLIPDNGPGDLGSIPGRVIPKTQKMVLDASLLNTQHYKVRIKGKVEQSREGVAPSPTHWCSSYRKGSLRVTLDYGRQLYLLFLPHSVNCESDFLYSFPEFQ